jgi:hypothetical protein
VWSPYRRPTHARGRARPRRPAAVGCSLALAVVSSLTVSWTGSAGAAPSSAQAPTAFTGRVVSPTFSYDFATALGGVYSFGGAGWYGNERWRHLAAPIVGMAVTPDGRGYWLVGANGSVFSLGDALWYGSLSRDVLGPGQQIVAMSATPDGRGYWLINQSGAVIPFGDAPSIAGGQPLPETDLATPIVAAAITPDEHGAWLTDTAGHVYTVGTAVWFGSLAGHHLWHPITAIAAIPSGRGYWLTDSAGDVWDFGGALGGSPGPKGLTAPVVGMIPAQNRYGYWSATATGSVIDGGDAESRGSTATSGVVAIAAAPQVDPPALPSGSIGYDINWPQCASNGSAKAGTLPGPPGDAAGTTAYSVAVVGVDGWAVGDVNTCLAAEVAWAKHATYPSGSHESGTPPYDLYMFLNSPSSDSTIDQKGPAGTCADYSGFTWQKCLTYNYGYNAAIAAVQYADSEGAHSNLWWLDIENDICAPGMWNDASNGEWWSCDLSLNAVTIQGALDALRSLDITAGVYCTAVQWQGITNRYMPTGGAPLLWIAGAIWTSPPFPSSYGYVGPGADSKYCTDSAYRFAGGTPLLLQETPGGGNNYPYDPDLAC